GWPAAGAVDRLGCASEEGRWPTLVPPLSNRTDHTRRRAALDAAGTELELHVRRLSLDRRAKELRRRVESVQHEMGRSQRQLRSLPWPRLASFGMDEEGERGVRL